MPTNRRDWLRQSALAALGMSIPFAASAGNESKFDWRGSEPGPINLGSNENPYGISPKAREAIIDMIGQANRYQFNIDALKPFRKEIARYYGLREENVLVSAGSGEALALAARHFAGGDLVTARPTFGILPATARKIGTKVIEVPLTSDQVHDLPGLLKAITENTKLVYIVNPANPTGTIIKPAVLRQFCQEASRKATVLIDEAYIDFLDAPDNESMIGLVGSNPNILVMRTFSKIHGMAGLRIGFTIGHPSLIGPLSRNYFSGTQFCISNLSMAAAMASLKDETHRQMSKEKNAAARTYTLESLRQMNYKCIPSYTNFMFFSLGNYKGNFEEDMRKKKIILHSGSFGTEGNWCRVSIGTMNEMKAFIKQVKEI